MEKSEFIQLLKKASEQCGQIIKTCQQAHRTASLIRASETLPFELHAECTAASKFNLS